MNNTAITKTRTRAEVAATGTIEAEVNKAAVGVVGVASCLIGIWAVACFVGGLVASGGPLAMAKNWFSAVIGG